MRDNIKIIVDDPAEEDALYFQNYSEKLANIIKNTTPKFAVGIFGKWGTGKTTLMRMIKRELDKDSEKVLTVWFDAWRYEREKYLAITPFLRQIRIALENERSENKKSGKWDKVKEGTERTISAFIHSIEFSINLPGSPVTGTLKPEEIVNSWKSIGSTTIDGERIRFHEHVTDSLKNALEELERENPGSRIVLLVDDLDRCTPENALEVLESIKAFFDIKGIVYVVGMDSESITHIIKQKYEEGSNIDGFNYLQKIVQLPFQIPAWKPQDIFEAISKIISKGLEGSELLAEFEKENRKELIVKAIEPNPRQVKRFINNIILARAVFGEATDIDSLIAVQALNFRREWNRFLELISEDDNTRKTFFEEYYISPKGKGRSISNKDALESYIKEQSGANKPLSKEIIDIFQELVKEGHESLRDFLNAGADKILRDIRKMEDYRRALDVSKIEEEKPLVDTRESTETETWLGLLKTGRIKEFNEIRPPYPGPLIHAFPYADLSGANLTAVILAHANLTGADFTNAELILANLALAYLLRAKLLRADLSCANL